MFLFDDFKTIEVCVIDASMFAEFNEYAMRLLICDITAMEPSSRNGVHKHTEEESVLRVCDNLADKRVIITLILIVSRVSFA